MKNATTIVNGKSITDNATEIRETKPMPKVQVAATKKDGVGKRTYPLARKAAVKKSAPKKTAKTAKKSNGKVHRIDQSKTIVRLVKENPRQKGTFGWKSFQKIQPKMTVEKFVEAGGRLVDLRWDIAHKFVTLK